MITDSLKIDSLYRIAVIAQERADSLEARINHIESTSFQQGVLLENFGTIYSIVTIVIGLLAVAIPIWVQYAVIRPANKLVNELENRVISTVVRHLSDSANITVSEAIKDCQSGVPGRMKKGAFILIQMSYGVFSESNIIEIIKTMNYPSASPIRAKLLEALLHQDSESIELFAKSMLLDQKRTSEWISYYNYLLVTRNKHDNLDFFVTLINTPPVGSYHLLTFFQTLLQTNPNQALHSLSMMDNVLSRNFKITLQDFQKLESQFQDVNLLNELRNSPFFNQLPNHIQN